MCSTRSCINGTKEDGYQKTKILVSIAASVALVVILVVASILYCVLRKNNKPSNDEGMHNNLNPEKLITICLYIKLAYRLFKILSPKFRADIMYAKHGW